MSLLTERLILCQWSPCLIEGPIATAITHLIVTVVVHLCVRYACMGSGWKLYMLGADVPHAVANVACMYTCMNNLLVICSSVQIFIGRWYNDAGLPSDNSLAECCTERTPGEGRRFAGTAGGSSTGAFNGCRTGGGIAGEAV